MEPEIPLRRPQQDHQSGSSGQALPRFEIDTALYCNTSAHQSAPTVTEREEKRSSLPQKRGNRVFHFTAPAPQRNKEPGSMSAFSNESQPGVQEAGIDLKIEYNTSQGKR